MPFSWKGDDADRHDDGAGQDAAEEVREDDRRVLPDHVQLGLRDLDLPGNELLERGLPFRGKRRQREDGFLLAADPGITHEIRPRWRSGDPMGMDPDGARHLLVRG